MPLDDMKPREISDMLMSIRRSIDNHLGYNLVDGDDKDKLRIVSYQVEGIRSRTRLLGGPETAQRANLSKRYVLELEEALLVLLKDEKLMDLGCNIKLIPSNIPPRDQDDNAVRDLILKGLSVADGIRYLADRVRPTLVQANLFAELINNGDIVGLARAVPVQKVGPIQIDIRNNRLAILPQNSKTKREDIQNAEVARAEIIRKGDLLLEDLANSNADPRLISVCSATNCVI